MTMQIKDQLYVKKYFNSVWLHADIQKLENLDDISLQATSRSSGQFWGQFGRWDFDWDLNLSDVNLTRFKWVSKFLCK